MGRILKFDNIKYLKGWRIKVIFINLEMNWEND